MWPIKSFRGSNHITGTAEPKVVKFCTPVGYINSSKRMTYHPQKDRGYGHVNVLKFCPFAVMLLSSMFVSDSWASCLMQWSSQLLCSQLHLILIVKPLVISVVVLLLSPILSLVQKENLSAWHCICMRLALRPQQKRYIFAKRSTHYSNQIRNGYGGTVAHQLNYCYLGYSCCNCIKVKLSE